MRLLTAGICAAAMFISTMAVAATQYRIVDLVPLSGDDGLVVKHINNCGRAVGRSSGSGPSKAVIWDVNGNTTVLSIPEGFNASAGNDINDFGYVAGNSSYADRTSRATVWDPSGKATILNPLSGCTNSYATGINSKGEVVGYCTDSHTAFWKGCKWDANGNVMRLTVGSADTLSSVSGINDKGYAVGSCGGNSIIWDPNGSPTTLSLVSSTVWCGSATSINNCGQVAGSCLTVRSGNSLGAFWEADGTPYVMEPLPQGYLDNRWGMWGNAINGSGKVAGAKHFSSETQHGILWDRTSGTMDLATLMGRPITNATDINDSGQVLCEYEYAPGIYRSLILTPVPEPSSVFALVLGLGSMGGVIRRKRMN